MPNKKTATKQEVDEILERIEKQTEGELVQLGLTPGLEKEIEELMSPKSRDKYKNQIGKTAGFAATLANWLKENKSYKFKQFKPTVKVDCFGPIRLPEKFVDFLVDKAIKFLDKAGKPLFDSNDIKQVRASVAGKELRVTIVAEEEIWSMLYFSLCPPFRLMRTQTEDTANYFNNRP